jgi:hypothetical protein
MGIVSGLLLGTMSFIDNAQHSVFFIALGFFLLATLFAIPKLQFAASAFVLPTVSRFPILLLLASTALATSITSIARKPRGTNLWDRLAGFLPFSDAHAYYRQILAAPGDDFDEFNSRRPLNAMIRILEFDVGGSSLLGLQIVQVALAAVAVSVLSYAIASRVGMLAASGVAMMAIYWIWPYASSLLTEINGFTLSATSMGLLLFASLRNHVQLFLLGIFGLIIAYLLRPYSPLMPAIFAVVMSLAFSWRSRKVWMISMTGTVVASMSLVFLAPQFLSALYSDTGASTPNGNTAVTLLGLARGTGWSEADSYVRSIAPDASESDLVRIAFRQAAELTMSDPSLAVRALARNLVESVSVLGNQLGGGYPDTSCISLVLKMQFEECSSGFLELWLLLPLAIAFIWLLLALLRRREPIALLFTSTLLTYFTFSPIVAGDGGWRVAATLYPGFATLFALIPIAVLLRASQRAPAVDPYAAQTGKIKAGATAPISLAVSVIGLSLFAIPYPGARELFVDSSAKRPSFTLQVGQDEPGAWTSANSGTVSIQVLVEWAELHGYVNLKKYLEFHGSEIESITFDKRFQIWPKNEGGSDPSTPLESLFQVEDRLREN